MPCLGRLEVLITQQLAFNGLSAAQGHPQDDDVHVANSKDTIPSLLKDCVLFKHRRRLTRTGRVKCTSGYETATHARQNIGYGMQLYCLLEKENYTH